MPDPIIKTTPIDPPPGGDPPGPGPAADPPPGGDPPGPGPGADPPPGGDLPEPGQNLEKKIKRLERQRAALKAGLKKKKPSRPKTQSTKQGFFDWLFDAE